MLRLPAALAPVMRAVHAHPERDPADIAAELDLTVPQVQAVLDRVAAAPSVVTPRRPARVQFRPPLTVQFTLIDPSRLIRPDGAIARAVRARAFWIGLVVVNVLAAGIAAALITVPAGPLSERPTPSAYGWLLAGFLGSMFVHEAAHAVTLITHGGRTHRMGFMFFYLAPAFFCDVRDSWSIPPRARVKVAVAGVMAQGVISAACGAASFVTPPDAAAVLATLAVLNILYWLLNLIPFVKLDGYVALAGYLDRPYLRDHAIGAFREAVDSALGMRPRAAARPTAGWVLFGAASLLFPVVLVIGFALSVRSVLASLGTTALWVELILLGGLLLWALLKIVRHIGRRWRDAGSRIRLLAAWSLTVAVTVAAATLIPIPQLRTGGVFTMDGVTRIGLLSPPPPGDPSGRGVVVRQAGIIPGPRIGSGTISDGFRACRIPLNAVVFVRAGGLSLPGRCAEVSEGGRLHDALRSEPYGVASGIVTFPARTTVQYLADLWRTATS
ncbi:zinc metalloprotease [Microbacterium mangrovi]|uniref:hypothetical protein n=1 Tax=Microbacterium mangrovi TaxID=1348253 RepID=UPI00068A66EE|nr:hypothetical protein [Microbacterium mangrovi]